MTFSICSIARPLFIAINDESQCVVGVATFFATSSSCSRWGSTVTKAVIAGIHEFGSLALSGREEDQKTEKHIGTIQVQIETRA